MTWVNEPLQKGMHCIDYGKPIHVSWVNTMYQIFLICLLSVVGCMAPQDANEEDFTSLFDGQSLKDWTLINPKGGGYAVTNLVETTSTNAVIYCVKGGGGNLLSEKQYGDFILRFDFKLTKGANNGLTIRAPMQSGSLAYDGIELQILDNYGAEERYKKKLLPEQFHGAVYGVVAPTMLDAQNPVGQWNAQEVIAMGRKITVKVNGKTIINADLNSIKDPATLLKHPGILRSSGHIGFLGHNDEVYFKNVRIKELSGMELDNKAPVGFEALFNGHSLAGWRGVLSAPNNNPIRRAKLKGDVLKTAQAKADETMLAHWRVVNGELVFDGKEGSLSTSRQDFSNYELLVDWKIGPKGDSGVYLRGTPQVQIWDPRTDDHPKAALGSGGLFNNKISVRDPLVKADYFTGSWNRFRILMLESRVHVFLNDQLVVKNTPLENYWDREKPIFSSGPIELQAHGNPLWFKNIYIREIK